MITAPDFHKKQIVFVFFQDGEKMAISNDNLIVKNKDGSVKFQCTCYRLFLVFAAGQFSITSAVIQRAKKFGFFIACMTTNFRLQMLIGSEKEGNTILRKKQYSYEDMDIGREIVRNKIQNQRFVLMSVRHKNDLLLEAVEHIDQYLQALDLAVGLKELMAYEGLSSKLYFRNHFNNVPWQGRQPRLKRDYVNSALDIGYSILFTFIDVLLECYGFDVYVGVLHRQFYMRKSLACDLVEPFRPLIDVQVKKGINLRQVHSEDFTEINHQLRLRYDCATKYVKLFMSPLIEEKDRIFDYIQRYYYAFMKGAPSERFPVFHMGNNG